MSDPRSRRLGTWIAVKRGARSVDVGRGNGGIRFTMTNPGWPVEWLYKDAMMVVAALNKTKAK